MRDSEDTVDVAVVGDAMIDEYYDVEVNKISPECPVPILKSDAERAICLPGGAANVAYQFAHFNFNAYLFAYLDADARRQLGVRNIHIKHAVGITSRIPRKKRFYCGDTVVGRWDIEEKDYGLSTGSIAELNADLYRKLEGYKCVIFSDYGKGLFNQFDNSLLAKFPITIVDPKNGDLNRWRGCTIFKPNEAEALRLTGKSNIDQAGWHLVNLLGATVLITQAAKGVSIYQPGKEIVRVQPKHKLSAAESVIGAGDCFVCFLAMALCRGLELVDAVSLAFHAGVLYVRNKHNKPLRPHDLARYADPCGSKIMLYPDVNVLRNRDYKLAFTNGCFDMLHTGHLESLRFAKEQGDKLMVGVNSDESVAKLKAGRPIIPLQQRMAMLAACEFVDYVVPFYEDTPYELIKEISPDVIVKGEDYRDKVVVGSDIVPEVVFCPLFDGQSTSKIIEKISRSF